MADTYAVTRSIQVDAPASSLYERIVDFHRWPAWSPWEDVDPTMERSYSGAESGVGAGYEWSGNMKAGSGRMEIVEASPDERIVIDLHFLKPFRNEAKATFTLTPSGTGTEVTWAMAGRQTALTRTMSIFRSMDRLLGSTFETGLSRLKADAEARQPEPTP